MEVSLNEQARQIISKILYITLATVDKDGQPWNSPLYSAFDKDYNFYWASWKENNHSKNILENNNVFIVIYDSTVPEGTGRGVYIRAKAYEVSDLKELASALYLMYSRKSKSPRKILEFLKGYPRRVYKAVPEKVWLNGGADINGNYIDVRKEVDLFAE